MRLERLDIDGWRYSRWWGVLKTFKLARMASKKAAIGGGAVSWHRPGARPDPGLDYHGHYFGQACAVPCAFAHFAL